MIQPASTLTPAPWQHALRELITDGRQLLAELGLTPQDVGLSEAAASQFACRVPRAFVAKMVAGDPHDPLLRQVLPTVQELEYHPGYTHDPLAEQRANPIPGLLHKYQGRVLLTLAGSCAVNCRYCFRRHFDYEHNTPGMSGWQKAMDYIQADTSIVEVIFSGGDPLMLPDHRVLSLAQACAEIDHIKMVRIHTRLPIVIPSRLTGELLAGLAVLPAKVVMVVHSNHPAELDIVTTRALAQLRHYNITALNQAVLLRGVNDDAQVLAALSHALFRADVLPYYLHVLDKVGGAQHFDIPLTEAQTLYRELQSQLPGYLVPKLVQEQAGVGYKVLVSGS